MNKALIQQALNALEYHTQQTRPIHNTDLAIEALRTELAKPEPTQARDVFEMSLAYEGHRISKQITGIEIRNTRGIEKLILDTLVEMSKSMVTEVNK